MNQVPPQPRFLPCDNHPDKDGRYVIPLSSKNTKIACELCRLDSYHKENYFILEKVYEDLLEAFRYTKISFHPLEYFAKYLQNQSTNMTEQDIDEWGDKLVEMLNEEIDSLKDKLKNKLSEFNKYFSNPTFMENKENALRKIQPSHNKLRERLAELQVTDQESCQKARNAINDFCQEIWKLQTTSDQKMKEDSIYQIAENIRTKQEIFLNTNVRDELENKIKGVIQEAQENFFSDNSFTNSKIANGNIVQLIKQIPLNVKDLSNSLELIFDKQGDVKSDEIMKMKLNEKNFLLLIQTKSQQKLALYYNYSIPDKSLLCSLTKNVIFQAKKGLKLTVPTSQNEISAEKPILQCGRDFIIDDSLMTGSSQLGNSFDISGSDIGNPPEYLANGATFEIEQFEIFLIKDKSIVQQQPQVQGQVFPQVQGFPQQQPGGFPKGTIQFPKK